MSSELYLHNVVSYIKENEDWYLKRFGYAACELWFCVEACNILNFDHSLYSFEALNNGMFCFNEDDKRDITIYNRDQSINTHIEAKLLYPAYGLSKSNKKINEVFDKFDTYKIKGNEKREGWFILVWSSLNKGKYKENESECFFNNNIKRIAEMSKNSEIIVLDVLNNRFKWRSYNKEIIVKVVKTII